MRLLLATALAIAAMTIPGSSVPVVEASCRHSSTIVAPSHIRVLRVRTGQVQSVDFRSYVKHVMPAEWGDSIPYQLQKAGAVAAKQYAWKMALNPRSYNGRCYHVKDTTADQLYKPGWTVSSRMRQAVDSTWNWTMRRSGNLILTQYNGGTDVPCAYDANGRLRARSARRCANLGWDASRILARYYSATVNTG